MSQRENGERRESGSPISEELLAVVRRLEIRTRSLVNEVFGGEYHSVFKGMGIEFAEVREYAPGDDVRSIDWNVTARTGTPYVKRFDEERELSVLVLFDASGSGAYTSGDRFKREIGAEICALIAFSAIRNNDKVGLGIFTDQMELVLPPRKGRRHVLRAVREVLAFEPEHSRSDLAVPLDYARIAMRRRSVIFLVSDFRGPGLERALPILARKHDVIPVVVTDPREHTLPDAGLVLAEDLETGQRHVVDTSDPGIRAAYEARAKARVRARTDIFRRARVDSIDVSTDGNHVDALVRFFKMRTRRIAAGR